MEEPRLTRARAMRLLLSIRPFHGHFEPAALLARAAHDRGDEVLFATSEAVHALVRDRGFDVVAAGVDPRDAGGPRNAGSAGDADVGDSDYGLRVVATKVRDLLAHIDAWRPDVIVRDPTDIAAVVAGEVADLPTLTLGFSEFIPARSWEILTKGAFEAVRRQFGVAPDPTWQRMHTGGYLDLVPDWFHEERVSADDVLPMQPTVPPGGSVPPPPAWLDATLSRATVGICFGTIYNRNPSLLRTCVEAARGLRLNVVVVLGPGVAQPDWSKQTPGLWVVPYVPLGRLLPRLDALITAGGFNTVMAGLAHGLPMLGVPGGADQPRNTRRVAELGCGLDVRRARLDAATATDALRRLITDGAFRLQATRRQELIAGMPTPAAVLAHIAATRRQPEPSV